MKRPILVAVVGYIIGIIWGLYLNFSIVLLYALIFLATVPFILIKKVSEFKEHKVPNKKNLDNNKINDKNKKLNIFSLSRYIRYIKLILNRKVIITIIIFSIISNTIVILKNQKYDNLYKGIETIEITGIIEEFKSENQYKKIYKIKVLELNKFHKQENTYLYLNVNKKYDLQYGTKVKINGKFKTPEIARNYGGFDYKEYLKTLDIYGTVNASQVEIIEEKNKAQFNLREIAYKFNGYIEQLRHKIKENAKKNLDDETYPIFLGLILGDTSQIEENVKEQFRNSNMSHILAVSGMHISYIILGISIVLKKIIGKKKSKIITIFILLIYILITGFSPSILRASIMGICVIVASLINRKNDTWTSISFSLIVILLYNPYLITNIGLQFSYAGTIGIMLFNKNILKILNKGNENKSKIKEIIAITISAQIFIIPLTLYHFNTLGIYFLLTNLLLSLIIGPIIMIGFIFLILLIFDFSFVKFIAIILNFLLKLILLISNLSFLPMSKIYVRTPKIYEIICFYCIVIIFNFIYYIRHKKKQSASDIRVIYILETFKYKFFEMKRMYKSKLENKSKVEQNKPIVVVFRKYVVIILILVTISVLLFQIIFGLFNKNLRIHFVDVGQGDCCFIEMPNNKTILIDGGGSEFGDFDVGKNTLIPYILDRGYTKVDYIFISHFDSDHIRSEF